MSEPSVFLVNSSVIPSYQDVMRGYFSPFNSLTTKWARRREITYSVTEDAVRLFVSLFPYTIPDLESIPRCAESVYMLILSRFFGLPEDTAIPFYLVEIRARTCTSFLPRDAFVAASPPDSVTAFYDTLADFRDNCIGLKQLVHTLRSLQTDSRARPCDYYYHNGTYHVFSNNTHLRSDSCGNI
jgi:hypothetical protein